MGRKRARRRAAGAKAPRESKTRRAWSWAVGGGIGAGTILTLLVGQCNRLQDQRQSRPDLHIAISTPAACYSTDASDITLLRVPVSVGNTGAESVVGDGKVLVSMNSRPLPLAQWTLLPTALGLTDPGASEEVIASLEETAIGIRGMDQPVKRNGVLVGYQWVLVQVEPGQLISPEITVSYVDGAGEISGASRVLTELGACGKSRRLAMTRDQMAKLPRRFGAIHNP